MEFVKHPEPRIINNLDKNIYAPLIASVGYINNSPHKAHIIYKNGLCIELPSMPNINKPTITVVYSLDIHYSLFVSFDRYFSSNKCGDDPTLQKMKEDYTSKRNTNTYGTNGRMCVSIAYDILYDDIAKYGKSVYVPEIDVVIHIGEFEDAPNHPYNEKVLIEQAFSIDLELSQSGFVYSIDLIDNENKVGDKYIFIAGKAIRIKPRKDSTLRTGYYIRNTNESPDVVWFALDYKDKLGIYDTEEEAKALGNVEVVNKLKMADLENEINEIKKLDQIKKHEYELELLEKKKELDKISAELKERERKSELEMATVRDSYERGQINRKEKQEEAKHLPAIIIGVSAAVLAIAKIFF